MTPRWPPSGSVLSGRLYCKPRRFSAGWGMSDGGWAVSDFKGRHFEGEIVLWAVR